MRRSEALAVTGKLASSVAHALNNPLAVAVNLVFLLQHEENEGTRREYLARIERELQRASSLANRTLSFYHSDSPNAPILLQEIAREVVSIFAPDCAVREIELISQIEEVPAVNGSKDELRQVLVNLLSNAVDSIKEQGKVCVRVKGVNAPAYSNSIALTVTDTGCGIEPEDRTHIFEPFFSTKGSVGIGLWITRDVILKHGGTIRLRSHTDQRTKGTVVSVRLPAAGRISKTRDPIAS